MIPVCHHVSTLSLRRRPDDGLAGEDERGKAQRTDVHVRIQYKISSDGSRMKLAQQEKSWKETVEITAIPNS